ncbi:MAG TPA: hypothetical protein GX503_04800 [Clostridiales bacterium]|nr:hypothetical protein [Clostridiales bacterium]
MSWIDKWTQKLSEGTRMISKKTDELLEIAEIKLAIRDMESEIEDAKLYIGELVYQYYLNTHDLKMLSDEIKQKCTEIDEMDREINRLKKKLNFIKGNHFCRFCGEILELYERYCPYCGKKQD